MSEADVVAGVLLFAITAYALFGGADFGAGFWDLTAGGAVTGKRPRALIEHSIGPVWEANHVWLIFCLVVLWTAFSEVFGSVMLTLFVPLTLAALGIVLRGSSFAFRKVLVRTPQQRVFGGLFAISSVIVPYCMGAVAGAIASGRVPSGGKAGDPWSSWVNPTSILGGVLAVTVCSYLAAVYLVWDSRRLSDDAMVEYFRKRAVVAAVVAGVVAFAGIFVLRADATYVFHGLTSRALPLVILSGLCGLDLTVDARARCAPRCTRPLRGRGRHRHLGVGRRAVGVHPADVVESVRRGCTVGNAHGRARRVRRGRGDDHPVARVPLRARPEVAASRGERRHAFAGRDADFCSVTHHQVALAGT